MRRGKSQSNDIVIFQPDLTETTTIARATDFLEAGFQPIVLGFRRERYNRLHIAPWREIDLGRTEDGRYWKRFTALLRALPAIVKIRRELKTRSIFFARNLDQLLLALFAYFLFNRRAVIAYEVVDIQPAFTRNGIRSAAIRAVERVCLRHIDLLVASSPAFCRNYFHTTQQYRGEWIVVENKLRLSKLEVTRALDLRDTMIKPVAGGRRWKIGYFGLIRGQATIELMVRLAKALPDRIDIEFRGIVTTVDEAWFQSALTEVPNIRYYGEYRHPNDLATIYGGIDLAWAIDLENTDSNSRWLLPCRFYEAGLFGVPCLAASGFEVGQLLDRLDVGWTFSNPIEASLVTFFKTLTPRDYDQKRFKLLACPRDTFTTGKTDGILSRRLDDIVKTQRSKPSHARADASKWED